MADARTQLVKLVEEVKTLQQKFQSKKKVVDDLENLEAQLQAVIELFPSDGVPAQAGSLPQDSPASRGEEAAPESDTMQLADFFENVSQSLIDAQTTLNERSLDYARNLSPGMPPAYYSIPSLKAEMKVGFSQTKGKGVSLILFSKKSQRQEYGESTVGFELVSSPPPPGSQVVLVPKFFVLGAEKKRVLQAIRDNGQVKAATLEITDESSLVLRYRTPLFEQDVRYLAVCPQPLSAGQKLRQGLSAFHIVDSDSKFSLDSRIFTSGKFVQLPLINKPDSSSNSEDPVQLVGLVENLGDVLLNLMLIGHDWLADISTAIPKFIVTGTDRDLALAAASNAIADEQLRKALGPSQAWAVVLRMNPNSDSRPRYLVVWPAKGRQDIARWSQMAVFALTRTGDSLNADWQPLLSDTKPSEAKPKEGFLWIRDTKTLKSTKPEDLNTLSQQTGDAVLQVVFIVQDWLSQAQRAGAVQLKD